MNLYAYVSNRPSLFRDPSGNTILLALAGAGVGVVAGGVSAIINNPNGSLEACLTAMQLVLPDGRTLAGADAVPELLRRIRGLGWLAGVFSLPDARPIARRVYAWIAKNRMRLSCER